MIAFQKRVEIEIDEEMGRSRRMETADRSKLNYTWATILEVLRISSSVPFSMSHSTVMCTDINGYRIRFTMLNLHSIHMDVPFLKDPKAFRPARLLEKDNRIAKQMDNRIVPFGLGRKKNVFASTLPKWKFSFSLHH